MVSGNVKPTDSQAGVYGLTRRNIARSGVANPWVRVPAQLRGERIKIHGFTPGNTARVMDPEQMQGLVVEEAFDTFAKQVAPAPEKEPEFTILLCQDDVIARRKELSKATAGTGLDLVIGHAYGKGAKPYEENGTWFAGVRNDIRGSVVVELNVEVDTDTGRVLSLSQGYHVAKGKKPGNRYLQSEAAPEHHGPVDLEQPLPPDPRLLQALKPFEKDLDTLAEVLAVSEVPLDGAYETESTLGNLVADGLRASAPGADIALISAGVVGHHHLPAGEIRRRNLGQMFPYENELIQFRATGADLKKALGTMVEKEIRVLTSGLHYSYLPSSGTLLKVEVGGKPLTDKASYTVVMNSFAYNRNPTLKKLPGKALGDCQTLLTKYLLNQKTVAPAVEGRVRREGE